MGVVGIQTRAPRRLHLRSIPVPVLVLGAVILVRVAISLWWLAADYGVLDWESGRHAQRTWDGYVALGSRPLAFFAEDTDYPPLLYLIASLGIAVGGLHLDSMVAAQAVLLIPALALGCYGAAAAAYGRTAGLMAAVLALGVPATASVFQAFLIDTTEMAMVALSIWAVLASRRFSRIGVSGLAGAAVGLGMLSKQNFPIFVVGLLVVVVLRGGWRHWRGLLVFALVAVAISLSWYWSEITRTLDLIQGASGTPSGGGAGAPGGVQPERWTLKNAAWYAWSTLNVTVLAPFALATAVGAVALSVKWLRERSKDDPTPELVVGALVAYAGMTYVTLKDPRYLLPALPYMAVLGAGWIGLLRLRARAAAVVALSSVALLNVAGTFLDSGAPVRVTVLPDPPRTGLGERQATLYAPGGWISGAPETSSAILDVMRAAARDPRIDGLAIDPGAQQLHFNHPGLDVLSREAGVPLLLAYDPNDAGHVVIAQLNPPLESFEPCGVTSDGTGIYLSRGPLDVPFEQREFYCPPGSPRP